MVHLSICKIGLLGKLNFDSHSPLKPQFNISYYVYYLNVAINYLQVHFLQILVSLLVTSFC